MGKIRALSGQEMDKAKKAAMGHGIDVEGCGFRVSHSGNIVCSKDGKDILVIGKDGEAKGKTPSAVKSKAGWLLDEIQEILKEGSFAPLMFDVQVRYGAGQAEAATIHVMPRIDKAIGTAISPEYTAKIKPSTDERKVLQRIQAYCENTRKNLQIKISGEVAGEICKIMHETYIMERHPEWECPERLRGFVGLGTFLTYANRECKEGCERGLLLKKATLDGGGQLKVRFAGAECLYDVKKKALKMAGEKESLDAVRLCRENADMLIACQGILAREEKGSLSIKNGRVACAFRLGKKMRGTTFEIGSGSAETVKKWIAGEKEKERDKIEKKQKGEEEAMDGFSDVLSLEIVKLVAANNKKISTGMVYNTLCGTEWRKTLQRARCFGKFAALSDGYLHGKIEGLVREGVIVRAKGVKAPDKQVALQMTRLAQTLLSRRADTNKPFEEYTEMDWLAYIRKDPDGEGEGWKGELGLLECSGLFCMYPDMMRRFLMQTPEGLLEFAEMMEDVEEEDEKMYWEIVVDILGG